MSCILVVGHTHVYLAVLTVLLMSEEQICLMFKSVLCAVFFRERFGKNASEITEAPKGR